MELKTIDIKGKEYVTVNERLKAFRDEYKGYSLESEIVNLTEDSCVMKAIIKDENGRVLATGYAQEDRTSSYINKTSFVENCETSAWGRALGNLGIGIDVSVASADEVDMAIKKQEREKEQEKNKECLGGALMLNTGKYAGKRIIDIASEDEQYLRDLLANEKTPINIKKNIEKCFMELGLKPNEVEI